MTLAKVSNRRIRGLDALKLLAVLGVIWIHTPESPALVESIALFRFAVPALTAASAFLLICKFGEHAGVPWFRYSSNRAVRLYVLFLFWNLIYLLARLSKHVVFGAGDPIHLNAWTLLVAGVAYHLWYLPVLAIFVLGCGALASVYGRLNDDQRWAFAVICLLVGICIGLDPNPVAIDVERRPWSYPLVLGWQNLPSVFFAFPVYVAWRGIASHQTRSVVPFLALVMGGSFLWISARGVLAVLCLNLSGSAFVLSALYWNVPESVARFGRLSFGIYAVHLLFVESLHAIARKVAVSDEARDLIVYIVAALLSLVVAYFLTNSRRTALFVATRSSS